MKTMARLQLPKLNTLSMVTLSFLMAVQLILGRFTVGNQFIRFGFAFLVMALIAKWFGPLWGIMTAAMIDLVGTLLSGGPFFIGFTLSAILSSFIYAALLYQRPVTWRRVIIAQVLIMLVVDLVLNTLWIAIMYHTAIWALLPIRILKQLIVTPIQILLLYPLLKSQVIQGIQERLS